LAKTVQVRDADGTTWRTLPGNSGTFRMPGESIEDTVFGQSFRSNQTGLITWSIGGQCFYKGAPGYKALVKKSGTATSFTGEGMTLVSGKTYKITNIAKSLWDVTLPVTVKDNAVTVAGANILSINYLFGVVTFVSGYTVTGPVTVDGRYLPLTTVAKGQSFTLSQTAETIDPSDFETMQANSGHRVHTPGLRNANLEMGGFYDVTANFRSLLTGRTQFLMEISPLGDDVNSSRARGYYQLAELEQSGNVGALEEETRRFNLNVPVDVVDVFGWYHPAASIIPAAIKRLTDLWVTETVGRFRYLEDGVAGKEGDGVVTDLSLTARLDGMNEFNVNIAGSGVITTV
jgi:hypothetical protein